MAARWDHIDKNAKIPPRNQCHAWKIGRGDYCRNPSCGASPYCANCARRVTNGMGPEEAAELLVRTNMMTKFYSRLLRGRLKDAVEAHLAADRSEQLGLLEELALVRAECGRMVEAYSNALELQERLEQGSKPWLQATELVEQTSIQMLQRIEKVQSLVTTIAKVENEMKGLITPLGLQVFINQLTRIAYDYLDDEQAAEFAKHLQSDIRMVDLTGKLGAKLTPDQEVAAMDDSIPRGD